MAQAKKKTKTERTHLFLDLLAELYPISVEARKDVADEAGVSDSTLYNWLYGSTINPRIDTMIKVAEVLGFAIVLQRKQRKPKLKVVK